jgi:hypothetical protein
MGPKPEILFLYLEASVLITETTDISLAPAWNKVNSITPPNPALVPSNRQVDEISHKLQIEPGAVLRIRGCA